MRTVVQSHEVAHLWANRSQGEARTPRGNFYFRDSSIYSYGSHFCIAQHLSNGAVAVTLREYSNTTSKHVRAVLDAASHLRILRVVDPDRSARDQRAQTENRITRLLEKAERARGRKATYMSEATKLAEDFNEYAKLHKERCRINTQRFDDWSKLMANRGSREARLQRAEDKRREEARLRAQEAYRLEHADAIAGWREFANDRYFTPPMLRFSQEKGYIETSAQARIPAEAAVRLWPVIQRVRSGDKDYEVGMQLGDYQLTQIKKTGDIVVGCHDIGYSEIEGIYNKMSALGYFDTAALAA